MRLELASNVRMFRGFRMLRCYNVSVVRARACVRERYIVTAEPVLLVRVSFASAAFFPPTLFFLKATFRLLVTARHPDLKWQ